MSLITVLRLALRDMRLYPTRSLLIGLSLAIGVLAVAGVSAVGALAGEVFIAKEEQQSGRAPTFATVLELSPTAGDSPGEFAKRVADGACASADVSCVVESASVIDVVPGEQARGLVASPLAVRWLSGNLQRVYRLPLVAGQWTGTNTMPTTFVLNEVAAQQLGGVGSDLTWGSTDTVVRYSSTVIGVVADGLEEPRAYGQLEAAMSVDSTVLAPELTVKVHGPSISQARVESFSRDLVFDSHATVKEPVRRVDTVADVAEQLASQRTAFLSASIVTILVVVLGIMNIGLASVRERSRELTIRRAVGATAGNVFAVVMLSSVLISLAVTAVTTALIIAATQLLPRWIAEGSPIVAPTVPWTAVLVAGLTATGTAMLGAAVPAIAATRHDPADVLRE